MAGMDWFRWHHGSVNDPKFQLVARKAKSSVAEVIAVWATILESASLSEDRGNPGGLDFEAIDCALGLDDGKAQAIHAHMTERALVDAETGRITAWDKRQPKREDETAAERKRRQREREHEERAVATAIASKSQDVTQGHAGVTHGHDREEKSREEGIQKTESAISLPVEGLAKSACARLASIGFDSVSPTHPKLLALLGAGITVDEVVDAAKAANGKTFAWVLAKAEGMRRDAAAVGQLPAGKKPPEKPPDKCACCGIAFVTKKIGSVWYCQNHDQYSKLEVAA